MDAAEVTRRFDLHLRIKVASGRHAEFIAFLRRARPIYEAPGGIHVRLLRSIVEPDEYIELVEYRDRETYERDQVRVNADPVLIKCLGEWRTLLDHGVVVDVYEDVTDLLDAETPR